MRRIVVTQSMETAEELERVYLGGHDPQELAEVVLDDELCEARERLLRLLASKERGS